MCEKSFERMNGLLRGEILERGDIAFETLNSVKLWKDCGSMFEHVLMIDSIGSNVRTSSKKRSELKNGDNMNQA